MWLYRRRRRRREDSREPKWAVPAMGLGLVLILPLWWIIFQLVGWGLLLYGVAAMIVWVRENAGVDTGVAT